MRRWTSSWYFLFVVQAALSLATCGTEVTRVPGAMCGLELSLYTPPDQDAFAGVSSLRLSLFLPDGRTVEKSIDQSESEFIVDEPPAEGVVLRVEGLDIDSQVVSSGQSVPFDLRQDETARVDVLFARTGEFTQLLGKLNHARFGHSASFTTDGRVLIFGGAGSGDPDAPGDLPPPELYDPRAQTSCGYGNYECPMFTGADRRFGHSASETPEGKVFVFGGRDEAKQLLDQVLIYEPGSGEFKQITAFDPLKVLSRAHHAAVALRADDRDVVAIIGGEIDEGDQRVVTGNGMLFDTLLETFVETDLVMLHGRKLHTATTFGAEQQLVLVVGGRDDDGLVGPAELFNGISFQAVNPLGQGARAGLAAPRLHHVAVEVDDAVLIVGGDDGLMSLDAPEIFVLSSVLGTGLFPMSIGASHAEHTSRSGPLASALPTGGLLLAGGEYLDGFERRLLASAEVLLPESGTSSATFSWAPPLGLKLSFAGVTRISGGGLLVTGGLKPGGPQGPPVPSDEVWYYNPR